MLEVEEVATGDARICKFVDLPNHFGLLLPLAGISTVRQIKDNPIDIRATNRLNKLHVELLKENEDWATEARRADLNQFMARLIFCFFAEDKRGKCNSESQIDFGPRTSTIQADRNTERGHPRPVLERLYLAITACRVCACWCAKL